MKKRRSVFEGKKLPSFPGGKVSFYLTIDARTHDKLQAVSTQRQTAISVIIRDALSKHVSKISTHRPSFE